MLFSLHHRIHEMSSQDHKDAELRNKLTALGVDVGPITDTTRPLYQRQLLKRQREEQTLVVGSAAKRPRLEAAEEEGPHWKPNVSQRSAKRKRALEPQSYLKHNRASLDNSPGPSGRNRYHLPSGPTQRVHVYPSLPRDDAPQPQDVTVQPSSFQLLPSSHFHPRKLDFSPSILAKNKANHPSPPSPSHNSPPSPSHNSPPSPSPSPVQNTPPLPHSLSFESLPSPMNIGGGLVQVMTNFIGAGVRKIVNHIASPRPSLRRSKHPSRWKKAREKQSVSPSFQSPLVNADQKREQDLVSVDDIDLPREEEDEGACGLYVPESPVQNEKSPRASSSSNHPSHSGESRLNYDWELLPSDVNICKRLDGSLWRLGKGGFGEVFKGMKDGVDEVAVKVIRIKNTSTAVEQFKQEIDMISKLRHRHILQFYGACIKPDCLYMVTELMQTDLFSALRHNARYQWTGVYGRDVMMGIAAGLHYLHSRRPPIVHRDIKSPNILLMDGIAKIADVGIARTKAASDMTAQRGFTIAWAAPEVVYRKRATEKIDIWSLGIVLWEVVSGSMPRPGHLVLPSWSSPPLQSVYSRCTSEDPTNRPTAAELVQEFKNIE